MSTALDNAMKRPPGRPKQNWLLNDFITVAQAVEVTGLSKSAILYHIHRGAFPGARTFGAGPRAQFLIPWVQTKDWEPGPVGRPKKKKDSHDESR